MADILPNVTCTYCQEEINGVRIQCCECPDFDICLQCFAVGAEIGPHKNDHSYKFVDHCSVSLFGGRGGWTAGEHLKLLDAAGLYSFGNWELVAEAVGTRNAEECREEYFARYLDGNIGKAMWANVCRPNLFIDLAEDDGPLSQVALSKLAPLDATLEEAKMLGYKPHRDDFEREYNPEAERLVAILKAEDNEENNTIRALKLAVVDMYIRSLRERQRRKRIVRDYQLVAKYFDNLRRDPNRPLYQKEQKELRDRMRPFAQFLTSGEHERLIASIERERELRHRLSELKRYRGAGLTTQDEIVHYEQHVAYQRQQIRQGRAGSSGSVIPTSAPTLYLTSENGGGETGPSFTDAKLTSQSGSDSAYDSDAAVCGGPAATVQQRPSSTTATSATAQTTSSPSATNDLPKPQWNLRALPMGKLLSKEEIQVCTNLNIQPISYVTLKYLIIVDNFLSPGKYQNIKTDPDATEVDTKEEVARFLSSNGWLPSVSAN